MSHVRFVVHRASFEEDDAKNQANDLMGFRAFRTDGDTFLPCDDNGDALPRSEWPAGDCFPLSDRESRTLAVLLEDEEAEERLRQREDAASCRAEWLPYSTEAA